MISHILYRSWQQRIRWLGCYLKCHIQYLKKKIIYIIPASLKVRSESWMNVKIYLTHSFSVKLVITSFTEWFPAQISYVSKLMKVIQDASISELFQDRSVTQRCWCRFKFRSYWITAQRPYPDKDIIEVPLKNTRDKYYSVFKWRSASQSSLVQPFWEKANGPDNKGFKDNRLHLSLFSFSAGGVKETALCGVKQQHQA